MRQVHCVSGTAKSTQTQCSLLSWDKVHFCKSTTNTFTTDQGVDTEKLVDGIILVRNAIFHFMSLPITNRSQSAQHCMSVVKAVQNQVPLFYCSQDTEFLLYQDPKTKKRKTCSIEQRKFSAEFVTSSCIIYNNDKDDQSINISAKELKDCWYYRVPLNHLMLLKNATIILFTTCTNFISFENARYHVINAYDDTITIH